MPPQPWFYGGSWFSNIFVDDEEIIEFCLENDIDICLDISHAGLACNYLGKDLIKYIDNLLPYTRHIHIADFLLGKNWYPISEPPDFELAFGCEF